MTFDYTKLTAEFPRDKIHWRAQSITRDGSKAMALAYIDARHVMDRLDEVCGPAGWQCRYPHAENKTCCEIGILIQNIVKDTDVYDWVWKSDGAGDTDIEGAKGAFSDAFKRAAVRWGIGRYLYDLPAVWVPCETYERNGKKVWKRFTVDPWEVSAPTKKQGEARGPLGITELKKKLGVFAGDLPACDEADMLGPLLDSYEKVLEQGRRDLPGWFATKAGSDVVGFDDRIAEQKRIVEARSQQTALDAG